MNVDTLADLDNVTLYLTPSEASELMQSIAMLLDAPATGRHEHVSSSDYQKEISVVLEEDQADEVPS